MGLSFGRMILIHHIGGDNKLAVVLSQESYPNIHCSDQATGLSVHSCNSIADDMDAVVQRQSFGPNADPVTGVRIPYVLASCKPLWDVSLS